MSETDHLLNCPNCNSPLSGDANYCSQCGQNTHYKKLPFFHFVIEFLESTIHFDNKIWYTLKKIIINPGNVIRDFNENKRVRYVPPIRLYIFVSVVYFIAISAGVNKKVENISFQIKNGAIHDSSSVMNLNINGFNTSKIDAATYSSLLKIPHISEDQIDSVFKVKKIKSDIFNRKFVQQSILMQRGELSSAEYAHKLLSTISKMIFLLMPVFAFLLWLFCGSKKDYYSDMLVFSLYIHAFYFILLLAGITINYFHPVNHIYSYIFLIASFYLAMSIKTTFNKKKRWAIFQTFLLIFVYSSIFAIMFGLAIVYSFIF